MNELRGSLTNTHYMEGKLGFKGERGDDGTSATLDVSKSGGVTTITATDYRGTTTTTILDGEITKAMVVDNLTTQTADVPLSANQGYVLNGSISTINTTIGNMQTTIGNLPTFYSGTSEPSSNLGANGDIYFKYSA